MGSSHRVSELFKNPVCIASGHIRGASPTRDSRGGCRHISLGNRDHCIRLNLASEDHSMNKIVAVVIFGLLTLSVATAQRLPETARPENYKLTFTPDLENAKFEGDETITLRVLKPNSEITLN